MPNVTGGHGSFGGSGTAGRDASNTGTGRSSAERARQAEMERRGGFTSGVGPDGRPTFTSTSGLSRGISVSPTQDKLSQNRERGAAYNSAAGKWNTSAKQRSFANFMNHLSPMGFSMEPPDLNRPATFADGDYHMGWNPGSLAGLTGLAVPGSGFITGPLGQMAYSAMGGQNVMVGGPGNMGMKDWNAPGLDRPNPGGAATPGGGQMAGGGNGAPMGAFPTQVAEAPGGASFGPQPTAPKPDQMAAFFTPKLPNHTVPQGYESLFPDSLSPEDRALLYARALA